MKTFELQAKVHAYSYDELPPDYRELVDVAKQMTGASYNPYSRFAVGAALRLEDGTIVRGCNQENAAYPSGLCAERTALFAAGANYPGKAMRAIAIAAFSNGRFTQEPVSPCGGCRQVMVEYEDAQKAPLAVILYGTDGCYVIESSKELMPFCFVAESLAANKDE